MATKLHLVMLTKGVKIPRENPIISTIAKLWDFPLLVSQCFWRIQLNIAEMLRDMHK